jgi:7,8-dihydro-6-hydroxymethylpterin-pyrophosphokinase
VGPLYTADLTCTVRTSPGQKPQYRIRGSPTPFVLLPLADIAPSLEVPGVGTVSVLLQRVDTSVLEQIKQIKNS